MVSIDNPLSALIPMWSMLVRMSGPLEAKIVQRVLKFTTFEVLQIESKKIVLE